MPESLSALLRMVSFTAAKTSRMLEVSVAWVKLHRLVSRVTLISSRSAVRLRLLRVEVQVSPVNLVEPPQQVLCCLVDVVAP